MVVDPNLLRGGQIGATSAWEYHQTTDHLFGHAVLATKARDGRVTGLTHVSPLPVEVTITRKLEVDFRHAQKQMARLSLDLAGKSRLPFLGVVEQFPSSWVRGGHAESSDHPAPTNRELPANRNSTL